MPNTADIPGELILPQPRDEYETQLFLALQEQHRQILACLIQINSVLP